MSKEYIEKEAALALSKHLDRENGNKHFVWGVETYAEYLQGLPPADVKPVVRGEWKEPEGSECVSADTDNFTISLPSKKCSVCGHIAVAFPRANFCPYCGADMRKEAKDGQVHCND